MLMGIDHFVENHFAKSHIFDRKLPTTSHRRKSQTSTTTVKNYLWFFRRCDHTFDEVIIFDVRCSDHFRRSVVLMFQALA